MQASDAKDPYDLLLNAGSSPDLWLLVGGPVLLLLAIVAVYAVIIYVRRQRDKEALRREVESEVARAGITTGELEDHAPEDYEEGDAYEIPKDLEAEELTEEEGGTPQRPQLRVVPAAAPAVPAAATEVDDIRRTDRASWLARLKSGLQKTRDSLRGNLSGLFTGKTRIDEGMLERLHEALYRADIGVATADKLVDHVRKTVGKDETADWDAVSRALKEEAQNLLTAPAAVPLNQPASGPWVVLLVGVNGAGKTTTIGKLGAHFLASDKQVLFGAGDTFRAAAIEQLAVWGERLGVDVVKHKQGSDPAAVAYDAVKAAMARSADVLLIDTAGRLHAKTELMDELGKINRIIGRDLPGAPHETWLVIDATTGQNAVAQVKAFSEVVKVTGLVVTKLDGTAKGGVVLGIVDQFKLPVRYIGVGEKASDLRAFDAADYADSLF